MTLYAWGQRVPPSPFIFLCGLLGCWHFVASPIQAQDVVTRVSGQYGSVVSARLDAAGEGYVVLATEAGDAGAPGTSRVLALQGASPSPVIEIPRFVARKAEWLGFGYLLLQGAGESEWEFHLFELKPGGRWVETWNTSRVAQQYRPTEGRAFEISPSGETWTAARRLPGGVLEVVAGETLGVVEPKTWKLELAGVPGEIEIQVLQEGEDFAISVLEDGAAWFVSPPRGRVISLGERDSSCSGSLWQERLGLLWVRCGDRFVGYRVADLLRMSGRRDPSRLDPVYCLSTRDLGWPRIDRLFVNGENLIAVLESGERTEILAISVATDAVSGGQSDARPLLLPIDIRGGAGCSSSEPENLVVLESDFSDSDRVAPGASAELRQRALKDMARVFSGAEIRLDSFGQGVTVLRQSRDREGLVLQLTAIHGAVDAARASPTTKQDKK